MIAACEVVLAHVPSPQMILDCPPMIIGLTFAPEVEGAVPLIWLENPAKIPPQL